LPRSYRNFSFVFVAALLVIYIFIFSMTMNNTTSVSAVETNGVGVYWDSNCSNIVPSIDWSTLYPGSVKNVTVYIRNEIAEPMYLILSTTNWNPSNASQYLNLGWNYPGQRMNPGEKLQITLTLSVSSHIQGISNFSFDILVSGSDRKLFGDVDGDGAVTGADIIKVSMHIGTKVGDPNYNPAADVNGDGRIIGGDLIQVSMHIGEHV